MCWGRMGKTGLAFKARILVTPFPVSIVFTLSVIGTVTSFPVASIGGMTEKEASSGATSK